MQLGNTTKKSKKLTLLLVDDEPDLLDLFAEYLVDLDLKIIKASNGQEAFDLVQNEKVDIVITDLRMPHMGGIDLIKNLRAKGFWKPVMVLTGHGEKKAVVEALRLGVFEFLDKPVDEPVFLNAIHKVFDFASRMNEVIDQAPEAVRQSLYYMELLKIRTGS